MYFLIEDDDLLEIYNTIWNKVSADIKKKIDSELVYKKNYLKTKITVTNLDYALKKDDNYYHQVFLKECKYIQKKAVRHYQ